MNAPTQEDFVLIRNRCDVAENATNSIRKSFVELEKKYKSLLAKVNQPNAEAALVEQVA